MDFTCGIELEYPGFTLKADFAAASGNLVTLLGPSGCGKTTLLRSAAGLENLSSGSFFLGGREITGLPPEQRNVGFVFQDYALFSHLSVYENVAYGPKTRGFGKARTEKRVFEKLDLVGLREYGTRRVNELSGGEQQRVALARALAVEPDLLLLDEPLSALDAGTRTELRRKISQIQKELSITTIYVTHDQQEALAISDTIVLLKDGRIVQTGPPAEIYYRPETEFAARFIGTANIIPGPLFFRPEHCLLEKPRTGEFYRFSGRLRYREYMGKEYAGELYDEQRKSVISFYFPAETPIPAGETVELFVPKARTRLLSQQAQEDLRAADT